MIAPVACVIPAYDAAESLPRVIEDVRRSVPHATVIVVDDGSRDRSRDAAATAGADALIAFADNRGKGAALRAGFAEALGRGMSAVLTMDADGQHDARRAPDLLAALERADIAIGTRDRVPGVMPIGRRITNALASAAVGRITGERVDDPQSGFRAIRRTVLERVSAEGDRYEFETDFLIRAMEAGFRVTPVAVDTVYGARSHFRGLSDSMRVVRCLWRHRSGAPR
ncbi:MAG TPA: glycosyltransferase family 2 protein [Gemmatimonadaceae bacterium]|nr:glycosyltransferase family 2 protein [Gemmatimonadaceae bacterium]